MQPEHLNYGYRLILMAVIVAVNAFFAAAETALVSVRPSRLKQMADRGQVGATAALSLLAKPERLLSVSQVGLTLASLGLGWLGEPTLHGLLESGLTPIFGPATRTVVAVISTLIAFIIMAFFHVIFGEVVPKNLAIDRSDSLAVLVAPALLVFYKLVEPFVWVLERTAAFISRLLGAHGHQHGTHSPEELKFIIASSKHADHLTSFEADAMRHLIDLQDYNVREVMVPRNQLVTVAVDADIDEVLQLMSESRFSRLPVYEGSAENLIGFVHVKDVLDFWAARRLSNARRRSVKAFDLRDIVRKAPVVPESRALHLVFGDLRAQHAHVAFVVDEFGTISGFLSIEDVFEQVFGEIEDEFDLRVQPPRVGEDGFELPGATPIRDLEMQFGIELPSDAGFETLAGFILYRLGRIPAPGDSVEHGGRIFTVTQMAFNRIDTVRIEEAPAPPKSPD
jgi:putative hemolysin